MSRTLTGRRRRFVDEYLIDLNATAAYTRAGYKPRNAGSARSCASLLMMESEVAEAIDRAMKARSARTFVTQDRVLEELAVVAFSTIEDYTIDDEGNLTLSGKARSDAMRAVQSVRRKRRAIPQKDGDPIIETEVEFRLWSKPETLKLTGQHLGMYTEKHEIKTPAGTGVLMVPTSPTPEDWAKVALAHQATLTTKPEEPAA